MSKSSYEILCEVLTRLDRLEDKLDKRVTSLENRVDIIEDFRSRILGVAVVIGAISGSVVHWVWMRITGEK